VARARGRRGESQYTSRASSRRTRATRVARVTRAPRQWTLLAEDGTVGPWVHSAAALLVNAVTGTVLFQRNADQERPVASLTKLMTALTFLDAHPNLDQAVTILPEDVQRASKTQLRRGEVIRLRDVMHSALMVSDNAAARVLARSAGVSTSEFVEQMNARARSMGLSHTRFVEPTGLDRGNVSTAREIAAMVTAASREPLISEIMLKPEYSYWSDRRFHQFGNTDHLLSSRWQVKAGKTGFTYHAGYCFAACLGDGTGREFASVVLGAPTGPTRFADVSRMMSWAVAH
jgi:D-alanyl-D-alanine endopeptidase (penicillin-binding protein 7)